ncbi:MAG: zinc-binding dehydrogenase [Micromonosporaceae bacterium]
MDQVPYRQQAALKAGADYVLHSSDGSGAVVRAVRGLTGGLGADVAIDADGTAKTFELCAEMIRPVGRLAAVGVHSLPATPPLDSVRVKDAAVTTGLVDTYTTPRLIAMVADHLLELPHLVTHRFGLDDVPEAYSVFAQHPETGALKVVAARDGTKTRIPPTEQSTVP